MALILEHKIIQELLSDYKRMSLVILLFLQLGKLDTTLHNKLLMQGLAQWTCLFRQVKLLLKVKLGGKMFQTVNMLSFSESEYQ